MLRKNLNKTLLRIFFSLLLVASIMFISNYIVLRNSMSGIYRQISENNRIVAQNVVRSFDECFKEVNNIIYSINTLPYQVYDTNGYKNLNAHNSFMILNKAKQFITQDYIYDFILYFVDSETVITSKGTDTFRRTFEQSFKNLNYAPEFWMNTAVTKHVLEYIPASNYSGKAETGGTYTRMLLGVVGNNMINGSKMNTLIFVDVSKLLKYVNQLNMVNGSSLAILDQDRNVIISTDPNLNFNSIGDIYPSADKERIVTKGKYEYYSIQSDYNNFIYINKIPYTYEGTFSVAKVNQIILIVAILLGILISLLLSKYLYKPVKAVLELVGTKRGINYKETYKHICYSIQQIQNENQLYKSKIDIIGKEARRSIFLKMLDDLSRCKNLKDQTNIYFKDFFDNDRFVMASLSIKHVNTKVIEDADSAIIYSTDYLEDMIQKALGKYFESTSVFFIKGVQFIALIGIKQQVERKFVISNLEASLQYLDKSLCGNYFITTAVSRLYSEIIELNAAFRDIRMCMAYKGIKVEKSFIDAEKLDSDGRLYFPPDSIEKLSNCIVSGNTIESTSIINEIIDRNIENNTSCIRFGSMASSIYNNIMSVMISCEFDRDYILNIETAFFEKAENISDYKQMKDFLIKLVEEITEKINARKQNKLCTEFLLQYINMHYEEDLYLENMAEIVGTSSKYFSYYFKKTFDVNFIDYLNGVRIAHAKKLLKCSDILVRNVYEKVGYTNFSTFSSTFKKYCGVSPSEYRKNAVG